MLVGEERNWWFMRVGRQKETCRDMNNGRKGGSGRKEGMKANM